SRGTKTLDDAFVVYLKEAIGDERRAPQPTPARKETETAAPFPAALSGDPLRRLFNFSRMFAYTRRESLELQRDPIRATLAVVGSVILMIVLGYGISMDVENLTFAVLDRDDTTVSREYTLQIAGSR